jgi:uncharacterized RDD family membrane protein YckC
LEKKPEEHALEYAGFWLRFGAAVFDLFVVLLLLFVFYSLVITCSAELTQRRIYIMAVVSAIIAIAYFIGFWIWRGQTPGKMITGIKVIRTDSSPIEWTHSVLRCFGYIVCCLTLSIGFIWIAFDEKKQGLHDKIADTYVVKLPVRQVALSGDLARGRIG